MTNYKKAFMLFAIVNVRCRNGHENRKKHLELKTTPQCMHISDACRVSWADRSHGPQKEMMMMIRTKHW
jgi:hypothetical protein